MLNNKFVLMDDLAGATGGSDKAPVIAPPVDNKPAPAGGTPPVDKPAPDSNDWRVQWAGEDTKALKKLERFTDQKAVFTAYQALQNKLSSGEYVSKLPKDAKPEELTRWREENGVPSAVTGYEMPEGLVVGDADKPLIDSMLASMHAKNMPKDAVKGIVADYYKQQEAMAAARAEKDADNDLAAKETLIAEWGPDYRKNANAISGLLASAPAGIKEKIMSARLDNGMAAVHDPDFMRWLAQVSREINPVATVVPAGGDQMGAIADEMGNIEKLMGNRQSDYWKGPKAEAMQARYRELVTAQERRK